MGDLAYKTMGTPGKILTDFLVVVSQFCFVISIIYFINLNVTPLVFGRQDNTKKATLISQSINGTVTTITEIKSKTITHLPKVKDKVAKADGLNPHDPGYFEHEWQSLVIPISCLLLFSLLVFVRRIQVFAATHVFADAMIAITIIIIMATGIRKMSNQGSLLKHVDYFNPEKFDIVFGISLVALEGVGIIIPVHDITENKQDYPKVICAVMFTITVIFIVFAQFCCMAWGQAI